MHREKGDGSSFVNMLSSQLWKRSGHGSKAETVKLSPAQPSPARSDPFDGLTVPVSIP